MSVKIIKNLTSGPAVVIPIADIGRTIPIADFTIPIEDYSIWAASVDVITEINADKILLNNGTATLSKAESLRFIKVPDLLIVGTNKAINEIAITGAGQSLVFDGNGKATLDIPGGGGGGDNSSTYSWSENATNPWLKTGSNSFIIVAKIRFKGSTAVGTPTAIKAVGLRSTIKIFDFTNSLTIAEGGNTSTTSVIFDLGTISNIPTGEAVFEVQLKKNGGEAKMSALSLDF